MPQLTLRDSRSCHSQHRQLRHVQAPFLRIRPRIVCEATVSSQGRELSKRALLRGLFASTVLLATPTAAKADSFLKVTGARGLLAEEEEALINLRREREGEARKQLEAARVELEKEAFQSQNGKLCATPFGVDIVGITELVALVGAVVGGVSARQRKAELERLNEQLRKINLSLRQQARAGTVYAPGLTYAPPTLGAEDSEANGSEGPPVVATTVVATATAARATLSPGVAARSAVAPAKAPVAAVAAPTAVSTMPASTSGPASTMFSMEEDELTADQLACKESLRAGKRLLKEQNGSAAMVRFEKALMLSKALQDKVQERRAMRGLAAAARLQHQYKPAIKYLERVLEISKAMNEYTGDADAYGTIADCYTDMGEFEKAAIYYDKYIECMNRDGPV